MSKFSHLHVHTQYSLLDGASNLDLLFQKAIKDSMPAVAITDHGNMFGAFQFVAKAEEYNKKNNSNIKPIVGCEFYLTENRHKKQFTSENREERYHQLLLAKNAIGYKNLIKLSSLGFIEGLYGKYPRIDKELILQYHEGIIATTCCLAGEVPRTILRKGEYEGEKVFKWWLDVFGDDYYVEIQRHNIPEQNQVNQILIKFAKKYNVKIIASNDSHYIDKENADTHDILLCLNTGNKKSTPTYKEYDDDDSIDKKNTRFSFYNDEFYFKTTAEMQELFSDLPEAIDNTNEIADKVDILKLKSDILLPVFEIPKEYKIHSNNISISRIDKKGYVEIAADVRNQWEYLKDLAYKGAKAIYGDITPKIKERIDYELKVIHDMGYAGYFLIVRDFIIAAKTLDVMVGSGRGSAAGSVVAYCIGIHKTDPFKYNLLFERFLNPERISLPDIDTDFDDRGRDKVIDYVVKKYGSNHVAQIITFGSMGAKNSIRDVARVLDLDLPSSNVLAKLVPEKPKILLSDILEKPILKKDVAKDVDEKSLEEKYDLRSNDINRVKQLRDVYNYGGSDTKQLLKQKVLKEAILIEGSIKSIGTHAAGVLIAPKDLTEYIPVCKTKKTDLWITQFEGELNEKAGIIKMDFLGLKNLTIIKDTLNLIKENYNIEIDIDNIPYDDPKVFELYQRAETDGTFQFESEQMKRAMRIVKPTHFEDLIAINALNRPGPMEYLEEFALRKHGKSPITYDLDVQESVLSETYGITVYQEQVMLLSQKIANFSGGKADTLRKVMGKKNVEELEKLKPEFFEGGKKNGHDEKILEKIWQDWFSFAKYAFNKSHSTSYTIIAYQTAYLKAHYPHEYMAALLTSNKGELDTLTKYLDECKRMGIEVLGPDINESFSDFSVTKTKKIRFGLSAIKGFGVASAEAIVEERNENGPFSDIFDFVKRIKLQRITKGNIELIAKAGGFDSFSDITRSQICVIDPITEKSFAEALVRFGDKYQKDKAANQLSLFDNVSGPEVENPIIPDVEPWNIKEKLRIEKEVIGIYISGHPLNEYKTTIKSYCNANIFKLNDLLEENKIINDIKISGIITEAKHEINKTGDGYANFTIEDYNNTFQFSIYKENYLKYKHLIEDGLLVFLKLRTYKSTWNETNKIRVNVESISLLNDVQDNSNEMVLTIDINSYTKQDNENLIKIIKSNKGKTFLKFIFKDSENDTILKLNTKKSKVDCGKIVKLIEKIPSVGIKLS